MTYNELKNEENKYVMNTYGRFPIALDHGKGATLWDVEGKKYIDLASGIGVNCMGYDNQILIDAITQQAHKIMHASNLFTTEPMVQVAKKLVEKTHLNGKVFFANSGAESNEGAIKLARKYSFDKYGEGRYKIVTLVNSFHGRTVPRSRRPARIVSITISSRSPRALTTRSRTTSTMFAARPTI